MNSIISPLLNIKYPPVRHWLKAGAFLYARTENVNKC